jgi:RNA polymerase sigma-70 factor (ECF subfamily)
MTTQVRAFARAEVDAPTPRIEAAVVPISDRVLLERHVGGDRDAFAQLMKTYASPIYGTLARCGVPPAERDDLFQEVFEKVHRAARRKLPDGPVRAWIFAIAINSVRDTFRRAKVRSIVRLSDDPARDTALRGPGHASGHAGADERVSARPDRAAEAKEMATFLDAQMARLPLEQREALVLYALEGLSLEEAASALDVPIDTVKTRVRRARLSLAEAMHRRTLTTEREGSR